MPVANIEGQALYYEFRGSGPSILFIDGAFSDVAHFAKVADLLCDEYTVVTYDRRGYSRSSAATGPTTPAQQADDAAALLAAISLTPAALYGNSSGAIIALDLLIRHPDAVLAAILHEPPLLSALPRPEDVQAVIGRVIENGMAAGGSPAAAEAFFRFVAGDSNWESLGLDAQDRVRRNGATFFNCEIGNFEPYRPDDSALATISKPVQLFVSDASPPFFAEAASWLSGRLRTTVARIPGTHAAHLDHPLELADNIRSFLHDHLQRAERDGRRLP